MPLCQICCDTSLKLVICSKCSKGACVSCYKTTIANSSTEAQCIYCKVYFSLEFLIENFTKDYVWSKSAGNYREHLENIFYDQQRALLPETQIIMVRMLKLKDLNMRITATRQLLRALQYERDLLNSHDTNNVKEESKEIIRCACPISSCNGFVNKDWVCGICSTKVCKDCAEPNIDDHICNENNLKNMEEIRKHTKPCPNCKVPVFKITGCYQMFCTHCKVFFDWSKLTIIAKNANVHNPHYTEYLEEERRAGRMPIMETATIAGIAGCQETNYYHLITEFPKNFADSYRHILYDIVQAVNHLDAEARVNIELKHQEALERYRFKFLQNRDPDAASVFKKNLQSCYKKYNRSKELSEIQTASVQYFKASLGFYIKELTNTMKIIPMKVPQINTAKQALLIKEFIITIIRYNEYSEKAIKKMYDLYSSQANVKLLSPNLIQNLQNKLDGPIEDSKT